ncbi:MAG: type I DNA topoisomerase [Saprospiraceae bacterium]
MTKNLLIVESPAKAKTIEKILGKNFTVKSSMGHIRDLPTKNNAVDIDHGFEPKYEVTPDKKRVVKELKDWVKKVDEVWLATDEDREGEAISWHLAKVLGLDERSTKRIVFREITQPAILKAIQSPRTIDLNVVNAQQARRILDRLVGFELSELLWKKVKGQLSAGRVQSVAVKLIVDREREIIDFPVTPFYRVYGLFSVPGSGGKTAELKAELPGRFSTEEEADAFLKGCIGADFTIGDISKKPLKRSPAAPFTTSTLQQEASRKLGFSVKRTMTNAQRLYEAGFITYMRTDSISLSDVALGQIVGRVKTEFGEEYVKARKFKSKNKSAQEAHEAIRPTYIEREFVSEDRDQQRLYELIRKRTLASQMADAQIEKTTVRIDISTQPDQPLQAEGEVLIFDGFLKVYIESTDDDEDQEDNGKMLPPLKSGQKLELNSMSGLQRFTRPPARYTEAGLVKKLEELGIGRPSTYAPTISKIMEESRGYITKESSEGEERNYTVLTLKNNTVTKGTETERTGTFKNRLCPNDIGIVVTDFLAQHFEGIMDYGFTAEIEKKFDDIADGQLAWNAMLQKFYHPFHKQVADTLEHADRAMGDRILGTDPDSGRTLLVRLSRLGRPVVQIGKQEELEEGEKPKNANLRPGQSLETLTYEEALKLFELPKTLGEYEGEEVVIGVGRYGPYVRHGDNFVSLGRGDDPMEVNMSRAIELIEAKREENRPLLTYKGDPVTKGKGRFGPFLKYQGMYVNIPKKYDPEHLTQDEIISLLEAKIEKEKNRYIQKWPDDQIFIEEGRWGPFIRFGKKRLKIPAGEEKKRPTREDAAALSLDEVKAIIEAEIPNAFKKKKKTPARKKKSS